MVQNGQEGRPFFWLALLIMGGGLFAVGVMVGRQTAHSDKPKPDRLSQIDARDQGLVPAKADDLSFTKTLSSPRQDPKKPKPPKPQPVKPQPAGGKSSVAVNTHCLQVASFREAFQAKNLMDKLQAAGFSQVRSVVGEVPGKGTYHRVRVGDYADAAAAASDKARLNQELKLNSLFMLCGK
ncbi:MAG: SPOR domain-containing protein [Deltaproteobacteria bacterium]|nr:SPOR domain-containing protein [Deltaproteobacteria bacterium]